MRCDFSIELVILCVTVSIHAILRPTSSDVVRRRTAIAPGAKTLRIACDAERIPRAHNCVQTGIPWLWVYADMHVQHKVAEFNFFTVKTQERIELLREIKYLFHVSQPFYRSAVRVNNIE